MQREYPELPLVGVGAIIIEGDRVVLVKRANPPIQGQWSIPGGVLEVGEMVRDAAIRESVKGQERVGLPVVTDGELRRRNFQESFGKAVEGFDAPEVHTHLDHTSKLPFVPERARGPIALSMSAQLAIYAAGAASIVFVSPAVLYFWFLPVLLAQPFLRALLIAEHTGCSQDANGLTNTRTTLAGFPIRSVISGPAAGLSGSMSFCES